MLAFINWDVDPEIFRFGGFAVRWYGLFFALSFYLGYMILTRVFKREKIDIKVLDQLAIYMIVGTVIGARLGHCLFYQPDYYLANPLEILKIWEGGLASHGAAIGIMTAIYFFSRRSHMTYLWTIDRVVIVVALAGFLIRMGNLMNSEIFGYPTDVPWGFIFHRADPLLVARHPTQIYEALGYLAICIALLLIYFRAKKPLQEGLLFGIFLIALFGLRFILEFLKEPQVEIESHWSINLGQSLSIPFILFGVYILYRVRVKPFKPWPH
jgi:phosphatidylglycerol:prolipoprotein diacylglycerol transferase